MAICRSLGGGLWEVRTKLQNREARVIFFFEGADLVLTHGFVKKERRTSLADLRLARDRRRRWQGASHDK